MSVTLLPVCELLAVIIALMLGKLGFEQAFFWTVLACVWTDSTLRAGIGDQIEAMLVQPLSPGCRASVQTSCLGVIEHLIVGVGSVVLICTLQAGLSSDVIAMILFSMTLIWTTLSVEMGKSYKTMVSLQLEVT